MEELFRNNDPNALLAYYRSKIGEFDQERLEWLQRIEDLRIKSDEKHQLEWELIKRKEEIAELQRSLTEANVMLFEERQFTLRLQRENDMLKVREMEDRRRLQELTQEQVVLMRDVRPETLKKTTGQSFSHNTTQNIVKTIYLPNEQLNSVAVENEYLKRQLDEAQQLLTQQLAALKEEIRKVEDDSRLRRSNDMQTIKQFQEKVQRLEKHNLDLNRDFYQHRQQWEEKERNLQEDHEISRQKCSQYQQQLSQVEKKQNKENKAALTLIEKKSEEYTKKLRDQLRTKEDQYNIVKDQYGQVQQIYMQKIRQLEEALAKMVEKYNALEKRRVLEIEGFKTDIKRLNQRIKEQQREQAPEVIQVQPQEVKKMKDEVIKSIYGKTQKKKPRKVKKEKENIKHEESFQDEDDKSSLPLQELEDIQRQLEDLERKMDAAKK